MTGEPLSEIRALIARVQRDAAARWLARELGQLVTATSSLVEQLVAEGRSEAARPVVRAMQAYLSRRPESTGEVPWVASMRRAAARMQGTE